MNKSAFDPDHQNSNIESRITIALDRISQAFRVLLWNESKEFSMSPIQIQILIFLLYHTEKHRKVSYLAKEFNMTKATISDSVSVLEKKGCIEKEPEQNDSRSFILHLTDEGLRIAKKTSMYAEGIHKPISSLPPEDQESLYSNLTGIIQYLNRAGVITMKRMCTICRYYQPAEGCDEPFCKLRNDPVSSRELRLDCPDYLEPYCG
jgi:DNA-binding MarR family transcriptional regulator